MKIQELYRSGVTDDEDLGDHERTRAEVNITVDFAHEQGYGDAFKQLLTLPLFKAVLEKQFAETFHTVVQQMVRHSSIQPGTGWTDDFEVELNISPRESNSL